MTDIQSLVFMFIDKHPSVIKAFNEDKLERYIDSLCKSYYGCAGGGYQLMTSPKGIKTGFTFEDEHKLSKKEFCELITEFLKTA